MPRHKLLLAPSAPVRIARTLRRTALGAGILVLLAACGAPQPGAVAPTATPAAPAAAVEQPARNVPVLGGALGTTVELDNTYWTGGSAGPQGRRYAGRTATFIYGTGTPNSTAQTTFTVAGQPYGPAELSIEGLDAPGADKTPIRITLNEHEIFSGPNPLPDDELRPNSAPWESYTWTFDAALLRQGQNTLTLANVAAGTVGAPPFVLLDHAALTYEER